MTDTPTPRQAPPEAREGASRPRGGAGRPPGPSQTLSGPVEGSGAARPLTDAELLAWSVVLAWRDACYMRGATFLLPPCPTCSEVVHGIATYRSAARCDMRLTVRPCEHVHVASDDQMDRIHRHAADMIHNIDIDGRLDFGKRWSTDDIINEALARTTPDNPATSSDAVDNSEARRQRYADTLRPWLLGADEADVEHCADTVLAVRDREVEQLRAGRATWKAKAEEIERDRDRYATAYDQLLARLSADRQRMLAAVDATTGDKEELRHAQSGLASGYLHATVRAVGLFEGPDAVARYLRDHADGRHLTAHDGPTVAEAAADDKQHWGEREWEGE